MASFQESIRANIAKLKIEADAKLTGVFKELATTVISNTPVLRGNVVNDYWCASNDYDKTTLTIISETGIGSLSEIGPNSDVTGAGSLKRINAVTGLGTFLLKDGFLSMTTSVPYAYQLEYLGGSTQRPEGFIRNSLTEVAAKYR